MRVASRRLRSALGDFKPYLRKGSIPISRLKAIAKSLGTVRDEDVVLGALEELRSKADEGVSEGIAVIADSAQFSTIISEVSDKNYVGTAPREAYAVPGKFWNVGLHGQHGAGLSRAVPEAIETRRGRGCNRRPVFSVRLGGGRLGKDGMLRGVRL